MCHHCRCRRCCCCHCYRYCCCHFFFFVFWCCCSQRHHIAGDGIIKFNIKSTVAIDLADTADTGSHWSEGASSTNKLADACTALGCGVEWRLRLVVARCALVTSPPRSVSSARAGRLARLSMPLNLSAIAWCAIFYFFYTVFFYTLFLFWILLCGHVYFHFLFRKNLNCEKIL